MFATVEEAEKAAAMLRRFGNQESWPVPVEDGTVLGIGHGESIADWEQVADFLLECPYPDFSEDDE